MSEADIEREARVAVRLELGEAVIAMERMAFGHKNITYSAAFRRHAPVIIRTNRDAAVFAKIADNIAILAALGLPVPRVIAVDLSCARFPFAYLILEKIPGRDLRYELPTMTFAQMTEVAVQVVGFQKTVAANLPQGDGFGYVSIGETGPYQTWNALLEAEEEKSHQAFGRQVFTPYEVRLEKAFQKCDAYLKEVAPTCFLDDLTTKNVIVEQGKLRGIVDFDAVCYGDPLLMVGLTAAAVVSDAGLNALSYVDEVRRLWNLSDAQSRAADCYSALMTLGFLRRFYGEETPEWNARMIFALENYWLTKT